MSYPLFIHMTQRCPVNAINNSCRGLSILLLVCGLLTGCASLRPSLGVRPPRPDATYGVSTVDPCMRLDAYVNYSRDLQEAYHSRASQNRWWIYVAGTLGLATIAASGGLAAAAASTTTIAIVAFSGGFYSSFFAFLGNDALAEVYTAAANSVDKAIAAAALNKADADGCAAAYVALVKGVSDAATELEEARTTSAVAALKRANAEKANLSAQLKDLQAAQTESSIALPRLPPSITGIDPSSINPASPVPVTLTVSNVNDNITRFDLKVKLVSDGVAIQVDAPPAATDRPNVYKVRFMPPKDPPSPQPPDGYSPELVVQGFQGSVTIQGNVKLKYSTGLSQSEAARALQTFLNAPGLSEEEKVQRLKAIQEAIKAEGAPPLPPSRRSSPIEGRKPKSCG